MRVPVPTPVVHQIYFAPDEQRIALIDEETPSVWVVNADGTGLNCILGKETGLQLQSGALAYPADQPFAGWKDDSLILHTTQGTVRVHLSPGNQVTRVEPYRPAR